MLIDRCILLCEDLFSFRTYRTVYCEGKIDHIVILSYSVFMLYVRGVYFHLLPSTQSDKVCAWIV